MSVELAYLAGVLDAKAYFYVNARGYPLVRVYHNDHALLERLKTALGGSLHSHTGRQGVWEVNGRYAGHVCLKVLPWLKSHEAEAREISKFRPAGLGRPAKLCAPNFSSRTVIGVNMAAPL